MTYQCKQVDIGDKCVECLKSTSFVSGLFVYPPNENTTHFIKCKIELRRDMLLEYLNNTSKDKIKLDVKENEKGFYAEVNNYKSDNQNQSNQNQNNQNQGNQNQGYQNNQNQGNQNQSYNNQGGFNRGYNNR